MPLYAFGSNGHGQLGLGHKEDVSRPTRCLFKPDAHATHSHHHPDEKLLRLAAGGNHTLVLFGSGAVYAAGSNGNGRCAHAAEDVSELLEFSRVVFYDGERRVDRFSAVSATWESSCFVEAGTGFVYVVGVGMRGELGLGENVTERKVPTRIRDFPPTGTEIVCISGSVGQTVVVLSNGEVYGWGNARKGQLGELGLKEKTIWSPKRIDVSFVVRQVACGREFTALAGDAKEGPLLILGSDKWGVRSGAPRDLKGYKVLAASWHGIYSHKSDNSITAWGRNDRGQLPPPGLPKATLMGIGSEHVVIVLNDKRVVAFGWGEHGNCGPETDDGGNVVGRYAEIPFDYWQESNITAVGAGCATSWLMVE
ncbi:alpha tubulin suppressor [Emydomyces testavorans]|uniref:Alpha tubulin suppressor n=1 Tax=Emydomyces testavorans TaxID=2070801 RepID=A0AAF0DLP9_9EURO|nr:alpha tubulin suppressor [Emydomyces testavorans]